MHNANVNINFGCGSGRGPSGCGPNRAPGQLDQKGKGKPITYKTSGGYTVVVDKHDISIKDPKGNEVKHHGDPHENLNGKHLKDWKGKQRSVVLADGTKITMKADGPHGVTQNTSIYDQNQNVQIANAANEIQHHSMDAHDTAFREFGQHDGETSLFTHNWRGDAQYYNVYNQTEDGRFHQDFEWLGMVRNGQVHDLHDDPRISHT